MELSGTLCHSSAVEQITLTEDSKSTRCRGGNWGGGGLMKVKTSHAWTGGQLVRYVISNWQQIWLGWVVKLLYDKDRPIILGNLVGLSVNGTW